MEVSSKNILAYIDATPRDLGAYRDLMSIQAEDWKKHQSDHNTLKEALRVISNAIRSMNQEHWASGEQMELMGGWLRDALTYDAQFDFDSYMQAMEFDRDPESRLWLPRRSKLMRLYQELQWLETDPEAEFLSVSMPPRTGKALAFDTPVLTRNGWKEHGDLTIRDEVIGADGKFHKVLAIHPVCEMEYEVEFTNGEKIKCHGNHEWVLYDRTSAAERIVETNYLLKRKLTAGEIGSRGGRYIFQLDQRSPVVGEAKDLPVAPYSLGAWLGDGRNQNPDICCGANDTQTIDGIVADGYEISWSTEHKTTGVLYFGFQHLRQDLQKVGLCYSRRRVDKRIPEEYLTASIEQRLELLAGLIDTDGTLVRKEHRYKFSTAEKSLRDTFIELISTFGWRCAVMEYYDKRDNRSIHSDKPYWTISFNPTMAIPCRIPRKQLNEFSKPRKVAVRAIRKLGKGVLGNCITVEGGIYCVGYQMVQTHNSSTCSGAMTWHLGRNPMCSNLMTAHSDKLTKHFYQQCLQFVSDPEYRFKEIFPDSPLVWQSSEDEAFSLRKHGAYPSCTCRSVEGTLTGAVEVGEGGWLYGDDLVKDLEEAMSPKRLQNKWEAYVNQCYDRRKKGAKQLMVGTRWDVNDPIGRMCALHEGEEGFHVLTIPALDPVTGESNFDYLYGVGFDRHYYLDMQRTTDSATYAAKYDGQPFVRQGQLYNPDELERYMSLPAGEPNKVVAVVDTKGAGKDYCAMPIAAQWKDSPKWFIIGFMCDNSNPLLVNRKLADFIEKYGVKQVRFESNAAGGKVADDVDQLLKDDGYLCSVQKKYTGSNKETRILSSSQWVIENCVFQDPTLYLQGSDYAIAMNQMCSYVLDGKNTHDDAPDSLSMLAELLSTSRRAKARAVKRPF